MFKDKNSLNEQVKCAHKCMMKASGIVHINFKGRDASQKIVSDKTEMRKT